MDLLNLPWIYKALIVLWFFLIICIIPVAYTLNKKVNELKKWARDNNLNYYVGGSLKNKNISPLLDMFCHNIISGSYKHNKILMFYRQVSIGVGGTQKIYINDKLIYSGSPLSLDKMIVSLNKNM